MLLLLILCLVFLAALGVFLKNGRRAGLVDRAIFSNGSMEVDVTKTVRRHLLSSSTLSIEDVIPKELLDFDDRSRLNVLLRDPSGELRRLSFDDEETVDILSAASNHSY